MDGDGQHNLSQSHTSLTAVAFPVDKSFEYSHSRLRRLAMRETTQKRGTARRALDVRGCTWLVFVAAWAGTSCSGEAESIEMVRAALTDADVLGFESLGSWSTTTAGAVLSLSSTHSQGASSLALQPSNSNGYTPIKSVPLTTLSQVSPSLAWDIMLPVSQPNASWLGTAQTYIDCPSRGIYAQFLAQVELTGKPLNVWNTLTFPLTNSQISALLNPGYTDLRITVVVNVQVPTSGVYRIDNLRFIPASASGCVGKPNGTLCTDGSACTQEDTCESEICTGANPVVCLASDQCHTEGTCAPATGLCSNPSAPNGTLCDVGNLCVEQDSCQSGTCVQPPICEPLVLACPASPCPGPLPCPNLVPCEGQEIVVRPDVFPDHAWFSPSRVVADIVDLGPDDFAIAFVTSAQFYGDHFLKVIDYNTTRGRVPNVTKPLSEFVVEGVRGNTSMAVSKPAALCSPWGTAPSNSCPGGGACERRWGNFTNYFVADIVDSFGTHAVVLYTERKCGAVPGIESRSFIDIGSDPAVATAPDGTALVVYAGADGKLWGRYVFAPPDDESIPTQPAVRGQPFNIVVSGLETIRRETGTTIIYNDASNSFIVGIVERLPSGAGSQRSIVIPFGGQQTACTPPATTPCFSTGLTYGNHPSYMAHKPQTGGDFLWFRESSLDQTTRGIFVYATTSFVYKDVFLTAVDSVGPPVSDGYQWSVPLASTFYDTSDRNYVFLKTNVRLVPGELDNFTRGHLYAYGSSPGSWTLVDFLGSPGMPGQPLAVRSLRSVTVGLTVGDQSEVLRLFMSRQ
jgi:hypothetical protein